MKLKSGSLQTFKYLGIQIACSVGNYETLNGAFLVLKFRERVKTWSNLPGTIMGQTNLIKMISMSQLFFTPITLTTKLFRVMNKIFWELLRRKNCQTQGYIILLLRHSTYCIGRIFLTLGLLLIPYQ